jgi:hypothetical protein
MLAGWVSSVNETTVASVPVAVPILSRTVRPDVRQPH